jgi:hypothetical protein
MINRTNTSRYSIPIMIHLRVCGQEAVSFSMSSALWDVELNMVASHFHYGESCDADDTQGPTSEQYQALSNATKSPICDILLGSIPPSIEIVQALLVNACYSEKGWLLTSMAARMALDLDLPASYAKLSQLVMDQNEERDMEVEGRLMRESRVWFESFVLENM